MVAIACPCTSTYASPQVVLGVWGGGGGFVVVGGTKDVVGELMAIFLGLGFF